MNLLRVVDQTVIVYIAGVVIALLAFALFTALGALFILGSRPGIHALTAMMLAASELSQLVCFFAYFAANSYWWRFVLRKLDVRGFGARLAAVFLGSTVMSGLYLATVEISRFVLVNPIWAPSFSVINFVLFSGLSVAMIFAGRWQLRYNFHSGYGTRVMDYWLLTPDERERLKVDWD